MGSSSGSIRMSFAMVNLSGITKPYGKVVYKEQHRPFGDDTV
jgi:hypothetical protein